MSKRQFEDDLKRLTEDFSMTPDAKGWETIAAALPEEKKRRGLFFFLKIAVAAIVVVFMYVLFPKFNKQSVSTQNSDTTVVVSSSGVNEIISPNQNSTPEAIIPDTVQNGGSVNTNAVEPSSHISSTKHNANPKNKGAYTPIKKKNNASNFIASKKGDKKSSNDKYLIEPIEVFNPDDVPLIAYNRFEKDTPIALAAVPTNDTTSIAEIKLKKQNIPSDSTVKKTKTDIKYRFLLHHLELEGFVHNTSSVIRLDNNYKGVSPFQNDYDSRKKEDKARVNNYFGLNYVLSYKRNVFKLGLRYSSVSYTLSVVNFNNSVYSGVSSRYSNFNYNNSDSFLSQSFDVYNNNNNNPPANEAIGTVINTYKFISLPFTYSRPFKITRNANRALTLYPEVSMVYNRLLSYQGLVHTANSELYVKSENYKDNNIQKQHFSYGLGAQLLYHPNSFGKLYLGMNVRYLQAITPLEKSIVRTSYNSYGAGLTIGYLLGKSIKPIVPHNF